MNLNCFFYAGMSSLLVIVQDDQVEKYLSLLDGMNSRGGGEREREREGERERGRERGREGERERERGLLKLVFIECMSRSSPC